MIKVPFFVGGPRSLERIPPNALEADRPAIYMTRYGRLDHVHDQSPVEYAVYLRNSGWLRRMNSDDDDRFVAWIYEYTPIGNALDLIAAQYVACRNENDHSFDTWIPEPGLHPLMVLDGQTVNEDHWSYQPGGMVNGEMISHAMRQYQEIDHYLASPQPPGDEPGHDAAHWSPDLLKEDDQ